MTQPQEVRNAVNTALDTFGRIDVLVNNAGYGAFGAVEELSDDVIRRQFETNVFGALNVMRFVLPVGAIGSSTKSLLSVTTHK